MTERSDTSNRSTEVPPNDVDVVIIGSGAAGLSAALAARARGARRVLVAEAEGVHFCDVSDPASVTAAMDAAVAEGEHRPDRACGF